MNPAHLLQALCVHLNTYIHQSRFYLHFFKTKKQDSTHVQKVKDFYVNYTGENQSKVLGSVDYVMQVYTSK
jgi:methyltransferase-like protein